MTDLKVIDMKEFAEKARVEAQAEWRDLQIAARGEAEKMGSLASHPAARRALDTLHARVRMVYLVEHKRVMMDLSTELLGHHLRAGDDSPFDPNTFRSLELLTLYQVFAEFAGQLTKESEEAVHAMFTDATLPYREEGPFYGAPKMPEDDEVPHEG